MKKATILIIAIALCIGLSACGRKNNDQTNNTTNGTTNFTVLPDTDMTIETNIPDPDVDTSMPMYTDSTEETTEFTSRQGNFNN